MTASSGLRLDAPEAAMLNGEAGPGAAFAMRVLVGFATAVSARSLIGIRGGHIDDACITAKRASTSLSASSLRRRGCACRRR